MRILREAKVVLITFDTEGDKFSSDYERNKFFRGLHGWKQIIIKENKRYCYRRLGLLDETPHIKVADSAFMVAMQNMQKMMDYFDEWSDKVHTQMMEMAMDQRKWKELLEEGDENE